ncbi:MAG TPA: tetratricopeptide repeat protein [Caulobacteraceae bacterium]|jgi:tol-pal system protein YbgF
MHMSLRTVFGLVPAVATASLLLVGGAHAQSDTNQRPAAVQAPAPDPNEPPRRRLDRLEREVNEVRSIVLQARATGHPVEIKDAGPDPEMAALQTRLDDLESTLRSQTGQIEQLSHDIGQAKQDTATAQAAAASLADRLDKLEKQVAALSAPPPPPPPPTNDAAAPSADAGPGGAGDAKTAYAQAHQLLLNGDYPAAQTAYQAYLDRYGDQSNASTARYWLGQVKYAQQDYSGAAATLIASIRGWPQTAWAPDAVILLSQSLLRLNKQDDACATLREFTRRYAKAPPATKARAATVRTQAQCTR